MKERKVLLGFAIGFLLLSLGLAGCGGGKSGGNNGGNNVLNSTIYTVSDSTCSTYDSTRYPRTGWGQVFQKYFKANCGITINNTAKSGRSTKTFISEGFWDQIKATLKAGDYVFIQMGHNDEDTEAGSTRATTPTEYKQYLTQYVDETRAVGAIPVLMTPVERWHFDSSGVFTTAHGAAYTEAVKTLATEKSVPFIDLQKKSADLLVSLGATESEKLYMTFGPGVWTNYPTGSTDHTHFTYEGAMRIAKLVADGVKESIPQLAPYININGDTELPTSPTPSGTNTSPTPIVSPSPKPLPSPYNWGTVTKPASVNWVSYDGSVDPDKNNPQFTASSPMNLVTTLNGDGTVNMDSTSEGAATGGWSIPNPLSSGTGKMTLIIRLKSNLVATRGIEIDGRFASGTAIGPRCKFLIRNDSTGLQWEKFNNTNSASDNTFDVSEYHIYHITYDVTPTAAVANVYVDGNPIDSLSNLTHTKMTSSPSDSKLFIGDGGSSTYSCTIDWIAWTTEGAFTPPQVQGLLPTGLGSYNGQLSFTY